MITVNEWRIFMKYAMLGKFSQCSVEQGFPVLLSQDFKFQNTALWDTS